MNEIDKLGVYVAFWCSLVIANVHIANNDTISFIIWIFFSIIIFGVWIFKK